jgi:hypothetical protein
MRQEDIEKIEKWNVRRLIAQIRGDKKDKRYAVQNLNRYLRKVSLPEAKPT